MARTDRSDAEVSSRRSVVPEAAGRSLWLAAAWTGVGAAIVCATIAIVAVAALWLPASSNTSGRTTSAIHAGLLTYLAAVHGGITVNGVAAHWLPLGMLIVVAVTAWRAGAGLADAAVQLDETEPTRLAIAGGAQAVSFAVATMIIVPFASLGTSDAPILGVGGAALLLFICSGALAFVRSTPLAELISARIPDESRLALRAAAGALLIYVAAGAFLLAGSVAMHHHEVQTISRQVGGGWGGLPILLLGVLAAPNAIVYAVSYLAGPGFALGVGTHVGLTSTAHGTLPAFPLLGAMPSGHGAPPVVWALAASTVVLAGICCARMAMAAGSLLAALRTSAFAAAAAVLIMLVLGWQAGGSIGSARLQAVGPSPWLLALSVGGEIALVSVASIGMVALVRVFGGGHRKTVAVPSEDWTVPKPVLAAVEQPADGAPEDDQLAG